MDVRIKFNKRGEASFISHLDLLRTFNRMVMRSGLKPGYSQGFNPHILISFAQPSSVGMITENDCADITFDGEYKTDEIFEKLKSASPSGIEITEVTTERIPPFNKVNMASYSVYLECNKSKEELFVFFEKAEILIDKKTKKGIKEVDIKPMILDYDILENDGIILDLKLASGSNANLNPALLVKAMEKYIEGLKVNFQRIIRTGLISEDGLNY